MTTIEGRLTSCITNETVSKQYAFKISMSRVDKPMIFQLIGGPTGYESFYMHNSTIETMSEGGWVACMGTEGTWDRLEFSAEEMHKVFESD